jgi:CHASE3 domain sensor protein
MSNYKSMVAERHTDEKGNVWSIAPDGQRTLIKSVLSDDEKQSLAKQINAETAKIVADEREARQQRIDDNLQYIREHLK